MKFITCTAMLTLLALGAMAQQSGNLSFKFAKPVSTGGVKALGEESPEISIRRMFSFKNLSTYGIYGVGNLNGQSQDELNAAGKFSGFIRPYKGNKDFLTFNFSYNKNASNNDSLIAGTFLFPEVGNSSFLFTLEYSRQLGVSTMSTTHLLSPLFEVSSKTINAEETSVKKQFQTISYVLGLKYVYNFREFDTDNQLKNTIALSVCPFWAVVKVPDEDVDEYRDLFNAPGLKSAIGSFGVKVMFQYGGLGAFADIRNVTGTAQNVPVKDLRGFNLNVGFLFNARIFEN